MYVILRIGKFFCNRMYFIKCKVRVHRFDAVMNARTLFFLRWVCVSFVFWLYLNAVTIIFAFWIIFNLKMVWFQKKYGKMLTRFVWRKLFFFFCCWVHLDKSCKFLIVRLKSWRVVLLKWESKKKMKRIVQRYLLLKLVENKHF